jgi:hypothetical protein
MLLRQMMRRASVLQSSPCGVRHLRSKANVQRDNAVTGTYSGVIFSLAGLVVRTWTPFHITHARKHTRTQAHEHTSMSTQIHSNAYANAECCTQIG